MSGCVWYVVGPTGAGKSATALAVAEAMGAEIVNADAFQLYRGLESLTAAPTGAQRARVPHHLYGALEPDERCDAARYAALAGTTLDSLAARGVPTVVVGGSGLYVKALSHGLADLPSDPAVRARLAVQPLEEKLAELQMLDPATAATVNPANPRHIDRALEICLLTGRPASEARSAWAGADPPGLRGVLLTWEREHLYERIDRRVEETFDGGAVDEVQALLASGRAVSATAEKAIGFREIREFLAGRCTRSEAVAAMQQATRRYAKRQLTWFRRERWLKTVCLRPPDTPDSAAAVVIRDFLHD